jgi:hypothetical protein
MLSGAAIDAGARPLFESPAPLIDLLRPQNCQSSRGLASRERAVQGHAMLDAFEIALFVGLGALFAVGLIILARWAKTRPALLAAYALIAVCFLYVGFAIRSENSETWIGFEMTAVAVFGTLAGMSIVGSPWFVVAGFLLHPAWALYVHYFGAGSAFAPAPFVMATVGFDIVAALYVAYMTIRGKREQAAPGAAPAQKLAARSQQRKGGAR